MVILKLRGGGASRRRKEARRKVGGEKGEGEEGKKGGEGESEAHASSRGLEIEREAIRPTASEQMEVDTGIKEGEGEMKEEPKKAQRFIVFIGNLPYTATVESISRHFFKVSPTSIRHSTAKDSAKSKGFAFLEFDKYDRMKTCLKLYHGSRFDDGVSKSRKVNVELTAGGGGSRSSARRAKLKAKNEKLTEERKRRAQGAGGAGKTKSGEIPPKTPDDDAAGNGGNVHPSRRGRVK